VETAGALVGTLAMIVAAWFNAGAYAFVVFLLVSEAVMLAAARRYCRWQAREQADWRALRPLARIGLNITGYNLLLYGLQQMDTLLMGHWFGATPLGQYNRAGQLLIQPATHLVAPFNQVLLSTLSRLGPESPYFARHLRDTTNAIAHFTLPFAISCMVLPHDVVCLVLGAGWDEAAPLLRWLAVSAATSFVSSTSYVLVVATGHSVRLSQIAAVSLPVTLIGLWAGRQHGPVGLAIGLACANVGLLLPRLLWSTRQTPVCFRDFLDALTGPMFAAVLFTAGLLVGRILAHDTGFMMRLAISGIGGGIVVAVGLWWWPRLRMEYCALWAHLPFSRAPTTSFVGQ
jgi:PST family polysaccharide transporter